MVSVEEAIQLIEQNTSQLKPYSIELPKALGYALSENILAPISLPPFEQSAMDGYAIAQDNDKTIRFKLIGETKAGDESNSELKAGEAIRIFTGAMVPKGATAVIMQEHTKVAKHEVQILQDIKARGNIRPIGEQIKAGDLALPKGTVLNPASIGFLASLGIKHVKVFSKPRVGLIVTGNELVEAGQKLKPGQIYESNSLMLLAALKQSGIEVELMKTLQDNLDLTIQTIKESVINTDVLILSGGISVGDYDFVGKAMEELHVNQIFYKVKQKPGKPLFFGTKNNCRIFALPGNPSASLSCFYHYVLPAIRIMSGRKPYALEKRTVQLKEQYTKQDNRAHFLKAKVDDNYVAILEGQSSAMLHTYSVANALIYIPEDKQESKKGELVAAYLLPTF
ncbi:MAG: molybdopterin molybdotransferase MoeA [Flavobacteriales bacterium]|nr:molybdopterin molybdotransferase MoeA [Flavobacteriales bacterium]